MFEFDGRGEFDLFDFSSSPWGILNNLDNLFSDPIRLEKIAEICNLIPDASRPSVWLGENVQVDPTAVITGPCLIGHNTVIRASALLRGNIAIGNDCIIGHGCELKRCVLRTGCTIAHWNYVGDSIFGTNVFFGAGASTANMRILTGLIKADDLAGGVIECSKLGALVGDYVRVGCNAVLNPGTAIGGGSVIYPLVNLRGCIGSNLIVKGGIYGAYTVCDMADELC